MRFPEIVLEFIGPENYTHLESYRFYVVHRDCIYLLWNCWLIGFH